MTTTDMNEIVGGEIDSWCTRCKRMLNHTVVAKLDGKVRRVLCLTCDGQHAYARAKPGSGAAATAKPRAARRTTPKVAVPVDDGRPARPYTVSDAYKAEEMIHHPQYGRGRVVKAKKDKIDVTFADGAKILVHARRPSA